jgi:DNA polymerase-3 subunit epsilon
MFETPIVMLDFETSGMSPDQGGRVTEVAALRIVGDQIVDRYVSLINCQVRISSFITELTGITQAMVNAAPPVSKVVPELLAFIGDATLAAHNASFDEKFLHAEAARLGLQARHSGLVCSVKLARRVFPGLSSYSLGPLASTLGIRFSGRAHRAEADAEVASQLLLRVAAQLKQEYAIERLQPRLLQEINSLSAAKVPPFLRKLPRAQSTPTEAVHPQRYRHYKGGLYEVLYEATQEADLTTVIVYRSQNGRIWTRPKDAFFENVEVDGKLQPRFALIAE